MLYKGEKITSKNIKSFVSGTILYQLDRGFDILPKYKKEQVLYRLQVCKDTCLVTGECKRCGCSVPERMYIDKPYETRKCDFPDFMDKDNWKKYKMQNKIEPLC